MINNNLKDHKMVLTQLELMSLLISFLLKALEILLWDGIIIKNVVNHITKSRIRLLIIKKSLEK